MTPTVILVASTISKLCALGGIGTALVTGVMWLNTYNPSFKKGTNKGGDTNDNIDSTLESLRQRARS